MTQEKFNIGTKFSMFGRVYIVSEITKHWINFNHADGSKIKKGRVSAFMPGSWCFKNATVIHD